MKTSNFLKYLILGILTFTLVGTTNAQLKKSIAVVSIDARGLSLDNISFANLVRLELEKMNMFEVLDQYEINATLASRDIDKNNLFAKSDLVEVGKLLNADRMLTGAAEKFGDKIVLSFRIIDVQMNKIDKAVVREFVDLESEINSMVQICLNDLLGVQNDVNLVEILSYFDTPVLNQKTMLKLSGPRMGAAYTFGQSGQRLMDPKSLGGYDMFPVTTVFGYQYEHQYLSAGDFSALVEAVGTVSGLEAGTIMPTLTFMNGFRFNKSGFEFGLGPVFRVVKTAKGYYDTNGEWVYTSIVPENGELTTAIDRRGTYGLTAGLIIAVGKTFRSGYLNIPVNVYVSPRKDGTVVGLMFGFNIAKRPGK